MSDVTHAWFRARLDGYALGLLDEVEERRFLEHAAACPNCAAAMKTHSEHLPASADRGHIPSLIIARWDRASRRLRGLARTLVREHLEQCPSCREDLRALGFTPVLELVEDLEEDPLEMPHVPVTEEPHRIRVVQGGARRRSWPIGVAGGVLGAAAALLIVTIPRPGDDRTGHKPTPPARVIQPGPMPVPQGPVAFSIPKHAVTLPTPTRGALLAETVVHLPPGEQVLSLRLPELFLPDSEHVELLLIGPRGDSLVRTTMAYDRLVNRTLVLGRRGIEVAAGRYELVVTPGNGPASRFPVRVK